MFKHLNRGMHGERAAARDVDCDWAELAELPSPRSARELESTPPSRPLSGPPLSGPPFSGPPFSQRPLSQRPGALATLPHAALVSQRHAELTRLDHFELLGVPETADEAALARAFQRETARFHPDRLRGQDERLRPLANAILRSITAAYRVLADGNSRQRYLRELASRRQTLPPPGQPAADPAELLGAARSCLRRARHRDAATLMALACEVAPNDVRCQALRAWLQVLCGEAQAGAAGERLLSLLSQAVRKYPADLELRMYRGRALQRLGRGTEALRDFSFVASADPRNVDAAREVRLHEMRYSDRPGVSGVFSRLFMRQQSRPPEARSAPDARAKRAR